MKRKNNFFLITLTLGLMAAGSAVTLADSSGAYVYVTNTTPIETYLTTHWADGGEDNFTRNSCSFYIQPNSTKDLHVWAANGQSGHYAWLDVKIGQKDNLADGYVQPRTHLEFHFHATKTSSTGSHHGPNYIGNYDTAGDTAYVGTHITQGYFSQNSYGSAYLYANMTIYAGYDQQNMVDSGQLPFSSQDSVHTAYIKLVSNSSTKSSSSSLSKLSNFFHKL